MPELIRGRTVARARGKIEVTNVLPKGVHVFSLVIETADGTRSKPALIEVKVTERNG